MHVDIMDPAGQYQQQLQVRVSAPCISTTPLNVHITKVCTLENTIARRRHVLPGCHGSRRTSAVFTGDNRQPQTIQRHALLESNDTS